MTDAEQELADKIDEIVRLLDKVRARDGPNTDPFMLGMDAGMVLGRIQAKLERRRKP